MVTISVQVVRSYWMWRYISRRCISYRRAWWVRAYQASDQLRARHFQKAVTVLRSWPVTGTHTRALILLEIRCTRARSH